MPLPFRRRKTPEDTTVERDLSTEEVRLLGFVIITGALKAEEKSRARKLADLHRKLLQQTVKPPSYPTLSPKHAISFDLSDRQLTSEVLDSMRALAQDPSQLGMVTRGIGLVVSREGDSLPSIMPVSSQYKSEELVEDLQALQATLNFGDALPDQATTPPPSTRSAS